MFKIPLFSPTNKFLIGASILFLAIYYVPGYLCAPLAHYNPAYNYEPAEEFSSRNNFNQNSRLIRDYSDYSREPKGENFLYADWLPYGIMKRQMKGAKKSLDLGLQRDYSGNAAAKHLIGLAVAENAVGPGKKRK